MINNGYLKRYIIVELVIIIITIVMTLLDEKNFSFMLGFLLLISPFYCEKFYIFGYLYWFITEQCLPKSRKNSYIWSIILITIGILSKIDPNKKEEFVPFYEDPVFIFFPIIFIIIFIKYIKKSEYK